MAPSVSARSIDLVVAAGIADWFRAEGFARRSRSFIRTSGPCIHTASFQAASTNGPDGARFAVNLGVEWPAWYRAWTGQSPRPNPALAPTFIQVRLHPSNPPGGADYWWPADPNTDLGQVGEAVLQSLRAFGSAFWEGYSDLDGVLARFESGERVPTGAPRELVHAALLVNAGRIDEAAALINASSERAPERSRALVRKVGQRLGAVTGAA